MRLRLAAFMTLGVTVLAGGCSGGGSSTSAVPSPAKAQTGSSAAAKSLLTIHIPQRRATASSRRRVEYVSPATLGIGVRTGVTGQLGSQTWQLFDVSPTSPLCSTTAGVETCSLSVTAPVTAAGTSDEFQVDATDQSPAPGDPFSPGNPLSSGDESGITITAGANNPVSISLTGVIGNLSVAPASYSVWTAPGLFTVFNVNVTANDFDNDPIFGTPTTFENEIQFTDNLAAGSPFTYPNPSASFLGLPPPAAPGPIPAPITYTAPTTGVSGAAAAVTVSTIVPPYLGFTSPTAPFTIDALVASEAGIPIANVTGVVAGGVPVTVSVNESGATSFTVSAPAATNGAISLPGVPPNGVITATNGTATFSVQGVTASVGTTNLPTITIVDANGTTATLTVIVSP